LAAQALGLRKLLARHVDADDPAVRTDLERRDEAVRARAAPQVDDDFARLERCEMKEMPDAGERFDGFGRDPVEIAGRVAEPLRQCTPHLEMEGAARIRRDIAVHLFDLALQLAHIDLCVHRSTVTELRARSPEGMPEVCRDSAGRLHCRNRRCKPV